MPDRQSGWIIPATLFPAFSRLYDAGEREGVMKKLLVVLAIGAIFMLNACGRQSGQEEPVTFTMMYSGNYSPDYKCLAKMTELTHLSLEIEAFQDNGYDARSRLAISTGENMPDLMAKTKTTAAQALSGMLLPISDYYDQMPHFMEFIEKNNPCIQLQSG